MVLAVSLLQFPFNQAAIPPAVSPAALNAIHEAFVRQGAVAHLVGCVRAVRADGGGGGDLEMELLTGMISRLVLGAPAFGGQFVQCGGLQSRTTDVLLDPRNRAPVLVDVTLIISQLARTSREHYAAIAGSSLGSHMGVLLRHEDAGVRARCCNLVGNMCRHSGDFYPLLRQHGLIPLIVACCADRDGSCRKFACFAIGNAGFHSSLLYADLEVCIAPLVSLLRDEDDKTKANAAGALGNLVRNSSLLVDALIDLGAIEALITLVAAAIRAPGAARGGAEGAEAPAASSASASASASSGGAAQSSQSPMKIALFSIGNMCAHPRCRDVLLSCGILEVTKMLLAADQHPGAACDSTARKYAARIESKMGAASPSASGSAGD